MYLYILTASLGREGSSCGMKHSGTEETIPKMEPNLTHQAHLKTHFRQDDLLFQYIVSTLSRKAWKHPRFPVTNTSSDFLSSSSRDVKLCFFYSVQSSALEKKCSNHCAKYLVWWFLSFLSVSCLFLQSNLHIKICRWLVELNCFIFSFSILCSLSVQMLSIS